MGSSVVGAAVVGCGVVGSGVVGAGVVGASVVGAGVVGATAVGAGVVGTDVGGNVGELIALLALERGTRTLGSTMIKTIAIVAMTTPKMTGNHTPRNCRHPNGALGVAFSTSIFNPAWAGTEAAQGVEWLGRGGGGGERGEGRGDAVKHTQLQANVHRRCKGRCRGHGRRAVANQALLPKQGRQRCQVARRQDDLRRHL